MEGGWVGGIKIKVPAHGGQVGGFNVGTSTCDLQTNIVCTIGFIAELT